MKISAINIPDLNLGKHNIKDPRLDQVDSITKSKKKTYIQVEAVSAQQAIDSDVILVAKDSSMDLILSDLEFVETRLSRVTEENEKQLFNKLKTILEKEQFINVGSLSEEEKQALVKYGLLTAKPIVVATPEEVSQVTELLFRVLKESGFISFFTAGEKETRSWLIKKGSTAWEASGAIHSDIQQGFIRAEIISFDDFVQCGGETQAKQAGKLRLEQKNYIMQDCDLANFRFNK